MSADRIDGGARTDDAARLLARVVAAVFVLVGIAGFIPGLTSNVGDLELAGHESGAELLGLFQVSVLHNLVHLAFGVVGLVLARRAATARAFLIGGGLVYLVLALYGAVVDHASDANFVPVNHADGWLHLALGIGMVALGLVTLPRHRSAGVSAFTGRPGASRA